MLDSSISHSQDKELVLIHLNYEEDEDTSNYLFDVQGSAGFDYDASEGLAEPFRLQDGQGIYSSRLAASQPFGSQVEVLQRPANYDPFGHIWEDLLGNYQKPGRPTYPPGLQKTISEAELQSLKVFYSWARTNGTVANYNVMRALHTTPERSILSLHMARKLALETTGVEPQYHDMCPHSHITYTGIY